MKTDLGGLTMGRAYAAFEDNIRGSIESGKTAGMIVWSEDLCFTYLLQLANMLVEPTIVAGFQN